MAELLFNGIFLIFSFKKVSWFEIIYATVVIDLMDYSPTDLYVMHVTELKSVF